MDETDREIIAVLEGHSPMRFTDIVDSLKAQSTASPPKISRKLKHLVQIGLIHREVTEDWPPNALYSAKSEQTIKDENQGTDHQNVSGETRAFKEPEKLKILLIMIFALVMAVGVVQGAFLSALSIGFTLFLVYLAYRYLMLREHGEKRLEMIEKRLQRIEERLFE